MFETERAKIKAEIEQIQSEEQIVIPPTSKYDKMREELKHINKKEKKNEVIEPTVQIDEKETEEELIETKVNPKEKTRNRVEGLNGITIEEDGDDIIYTIPDDDEEEEEKAEEESVEVPDPVINTPEYINGGNAEPPPADQDQEGFKSEIAKQLFDVPRKKILQRTELPRRMILPMSMQKTAIFLATQPYSKNCETGPEHWMYEYGFLMLSAGRKVRMEGMAAFQPVGEGGSSENINF